MIPILLGLAVSLAPAFTLVLTLAYIAMRHPRLFLVIFMLLTAFESTRDFAPSLGVSLSGISVYPNDLIMVIGLGAALIRMGQWRLRGVARTSALVYVSFVGLGAITWIYTFGGQVGANFWRLPMLAAAMLLYTTTRSGAWSWCDLRVIMVAPAIVVALSSVVGIILYGFGSNSSGVAVAGGMVSDSRPVSAPGSLLMLMGLWVTVLSAGKWTGRRHLIVALLGSMVVLTQNRSVWVAAILGVLVWWLVPTIRSHGAFGGLGGTSRAILVFLGATATGLVGVSITALRQSATDDQTFLWRMARWADSMSIPRSWTEWLVGAILGPTPAAEPGLLAPHSLYVIAIEMTGLIGLGTLLFLVLAVRSARVPPSITLLGPVVCFSLLGFGVAYPLPPWAWMFVGILLATNRVDFAPEEVPLIHVKEHGRGKPRLSNPRPSTECESLT